MPWAALGAAACAAPAYAPCPLAVPAPWPSDAFRRCCDVLRTGFGPLASSDAAAFRIETQWQPCSEPPGERRAYVFRESYRGRDELAIVVEVRWLSIPWIGLPGWRGPRGDAAAERELATLLEVAFRGVPADPNGGDPPGAGAVLPPTLD